MGIYSIWGKKVGGLHLGYIEADSRKHAIELAKVILPEHKKLVAVLRPFDRAHVDKYAGDCPLQSMRN